MTPEKQRPGGNRGARSDDIDSVAKLSDVLAQRIPKAHLRASWMLDVLRTEASKLPILNGVPSEPAANVEEFLDETARRARDPDVFAVLDEEDPEYDWVVPGLLERQDRLILTGLEGQGKSTFLRQFAVQVAAGVHPFTLEETPARRVLLIDLENGRRHLKRKLRVLTIAAGDRLGRDMLIPISRTEPLDVLREEHASWLRERVQVNAPEILVLGPLYKLADSEESKDADARAVTELIDEIRAHSGVSVLIEAHVPHRQGNTPQPMRPFGPSRWKRWPEFGIYLGPTGELEHWRGPRDEREWPAALRRGGAWPWMPAERDERDLKLEAFLRSRKQDGEDMGVRACRRAAAEAGFTRQATVVDEIRSRVLAAT